MEITKGRIDRAQKIVVYGPEGVGKSTLASLFPNPVFIDTEGSTAQLDVARAPDPTTFGGLLATLQNPALAEFNTVVIDTVDWAEKLATDEVLIEHNKDSIEGIGYGKGYRFIFDKMGKLIERADALIAKNISVVMLAHSMIKKFDAPPDGEDVAAYDRYELKLQNSPKANVAALVKEWGDMLLFFNHKTFEVEQEKRKKVEQGKRTLYTSRMAGFDAKNRHGLPAEMPLRGLELPKELAEAVKPVGAVKKASPKPQAEKIAEGSKTPEPKKETQVETKPIDSTMVDPALLEKLKVANITLEELKDFYVTKGHHTEEVDPCDLPDRYITALLKPDNWAKAVSAINNKKGA